MSRTGLKRVRFAVEILFLVAGLAVFFFATQIPHTLIRIYGQTQFVPSLLKLLYRTAGVSSFLFLALLLFVLLTGRVYCSTLCPLGGLMDAVSRIGRRKRMSYRQPGRTARIAWAASGLLAGLPLVAGSVLFAGFLDPFSLFGRIVNHLAFPFVALLANPLVTLVHAAGWYDVNYIRMPSLTAAAFLVTLGFFVLIVVFSFFRGRLFCNLICPVGALLGLVNRIAPLRVRLDRRKCTACGACEPVCKSECISLADRRLDASRCVSCFNCIEKCPADAVAFSFPGGAGTDRAVTPDPSRREFMKFAGLTGTAGIIALSSCGRSLLPRMPVELPVIPPGAGDFDRFTRTCVSCQLCSRVCPTGVIRPGLVSAGGRGLFQPRLDFWRGYCEYRCEACSQVCPSGALRSFPKGEKQLSQLGDLFLNRSDCIVYEKNLDCGACAEQCPTHAVVMVPYRRGLMVPMLYPDRCIGCGACEYYCPTSPRKAIYVTGRRVHGRMKPWVPVNKARETGGRTGFPF